VLQSAKDILCSGVENAVLGRSCSYVVTSQHASLNYAVVHKKVPLLFFE